MDKNCFLIWRDEKRKHLWTDCNQSIGFYELTCLCWILLFFVQMRNIDKELETFLKWLNLILSPLSKPLPLLISLEWKSAYRDLYYREIYFVVSSQHIWSRTVMNMIIAMAVKVMLPLTGWRTGWLKLMSDDGYFYTISFDYNSLWKSSFYAYQSINFHEPYIFVRCRHTGQLQLFNLI